jgi:hypothetical protein
VLLSREDYAAKIDAYIKAAPNNDYLKREYGVIVVDLLRTFQKMSFYAYGQVSSTKLENLNLIALSNILLILTHNDLEISEGIWGYL